MLHQRILVLDGVLDDDNGTLLATQLLTLAAEDPAADVALWIHSPGGSVPSMLAIRDVMRLVPCEVSTLALGLACSAGQFLLSAGTKGKRFALPHARNLMHRGSAGIGGSAVDIEVQAGDLRHTVDTVLGMARWVGPRRRAEDRVRGTREGGAQMRPGGEGEIQHEQLHHPERHRPASPRRADHGRVLAPAHRAHRLPRYRDRSRRRQCAHRSVAAS
jgi:ATP-dependent Clp endopeptidase proteolytic subunit ClpP